MGLRVHKYGGTSLATAQRIRDIAARLADERRRGHELIVVVSAMGDATNQLHSLASEICPTPDPRELDMLLTTGERVSMSLMAMALKAAGIHSMSLTGSQSGIITDSAHTRARILDVKGDRIRQALDDGAIVIVAGFQGVSAEREITTLGRGGSDVTAVAIAARFDAERCEIFTDVDGVYSANPGRVQSARRIAELDHASMVTYARLGAGVLHARAALRAARDSVPLVIRSSFIPGSGTVVSNAVTDVPPIVGVGCARRVARLEIVGDSGALSAVNDDPRLPVLACASGAAHTVLHVEHGLEESLMESLGAGASIASRSEGTLVSVVCRQDVDPGDACREAIASDVLVGNHVDHIPGATLMLVAPDAADQVVLDLHRSLVEEPLEENVPSA